MAEPEKIESGGRGGLDPDLDLEFPPLPRTVTEVSQLIAEKTDPPDTPRLVEIVKTDPVVGVAVLRRINSAYYGLRSRVVQIEKACQFLGFDEVCDIVLTAGVIEMGDLFETDKQFHIFDGIMELSLGSAAFMKRLAEEYELKQAPLAFTSGLLHTIGRLVLLYNRPQEYESLWYAKASGCPPSVMSEQLTFGIDHTELSAVAGDKWSLDDDIVCVMRNYLTPGHVHVPDLRVLSLALATSSAAADHYCLDAENARGAAFSPPAIMYAFAKQAGVKPDALKKFLDQESKAVHQFVRSMKEPHEE